jgi:putative sterol carrier protein
MNRLLNILPILFFSALMTAGFSSGFSLPTMRTASLLLLIAVGVVLAILRKKDGISPISWTFAAYLGLAAIAFWLWPAGLGRLLSRVPLAFLYLMLLLTATVPQLLGRKPFTTFFAERRTPEPARATDIYKRINLTMSWVWAAIFAVCLLMSLLPQLLTHIAFSRAETLIFTSLVPLVLNLGIGLPFTMKYPDYYQRKLGITPIGQANPLSKENAMNSGSKQAAGPLSVDNCRDLLKIMPQGFNPQAAGDMKATLQFHVSGDDEFSAYLEIADGACAYHEGEATQPDLVIDTPGQVWLDISQGRLNGQEAFFKGLYKVNGEFSILMKLNELFSA